MRDLVLGSVAIIWVLLILSLSILAGLAINY